MSAYLFALPDGGGAVPPTLSVAGALVRRGHDVRVLTDPILEPEVTAAGAAFVSWSRAPHRKDRSVEGEVIRDWEARTPTGQFALARDRLIFGPAGLFAADILAELERRPADALVTETLLAAGPLAAEAAGLPVAVLQTTIDPLPAPGVPPFGPGLQPAAGPLGRARDAALGAITMRMWNKGLPALNAARAGYGLAPVDDALEPYRRADRFLILTSEGFDFPSAGRAANTRYVGPRLEDPSWTGSWEPPPGDAPLILVGLSSTNQKQVPVLQRIARALGTLPVRGLITTGPSVPAGAIDAPANVTVLPSAPHAEVLRHAAAAITHAGHGTVIKSLAAGVPVLCLPMGRDQADVAARVVAHGAGRRLRPGSSPRAIAKTLWALLADDSCRAGAARIAKLIAADLAEDRAVAELEALAVQAHVPVPV